MMRGFNWFANPLTRKRFKRFKESRLAWISFLCLVTVYLISLAAELICNDVPIYVRYEGRTYFPVWRFYPDDLFTGSGKMTRPDYKQIRQSDRFRQNPENRMIFPPIPFSPYESIDPASISTSNDVKLRITPATLVGRVNITKDFIIVKSTGFAPFLGKIHETDVRGTKLIDHFHLPQRVMASIQQRFANQPAPRISVDIPAGKDRVIRVILSRYTPRTREPRTIRIRFQEVLLSRSETTEFQFDPHLTLRKGPRQTWEGFSQSEKDVLLEMVHRRLAGPVIPRTLNLAGKRVTVAVIREEIRFPYPPTQDHWLGIDGAGRDVFVRIFYGLRTSLTFGFLLVTLTMAVGIAAGAIQGYYGGAVDICGQRFVEIWSALPFLYIMILMGSVYGRSFFLLLVCYGIFNWIGISYYIRAEFLKLRKQPFVEAARCMGLGPVAIIFRHILPNALVPVITFFPFSLVSAIYALTALDYLGFGLPPPTPSWGELLYQAQQYRWAWWLILYPSLALFIVMLFGVFIGEGIRNAYDPKRFSRWE